LHESLNFSFFHEENVFPYPQCLRRIFDWRKMRNGLGRPGITLHHHRLSSTLTFSQRLAEMISSFGKDRR
jgi:hypothetical protein